MTVFRRANGPFDRFLSLGFGCLAALVCACVLLSYVWFEQVNVSAEEYGVSIMLHNTLDEPVFVAVSGPSRGEMREWRRTYMPAETFQIQTSGPGEILRFQQRQQQITIRAATFSDQPVFCVQSNWDDLWQMFLHNQMIVIVRGELAC